MFSAGNLNTAALSLFLALHRAVEPLVPCLVFDDPVQSMDEVHVTQFAGPDESSIERSMAARSSSPSTSESFSRHLALELSPAFEGDELITIELGDRRTCRRRSSADYVDTRSSDSRMNGLLRRGGGSPQLKAYFFCRADRI